MHPLKKWTIAGAVGFTALVASLNGSAGATNYPPTTNTAATTTTIATTTTARVIPSSGPPTSTPGRGTAPTSLPGRGNTTSTVALVAANASVDPSDPAVVDAATLGLPNTGSDTATPVIIGTGFIVAGLSAVAFTRRKRRPAAI